MENGGQFAAFYGRIIQHGPFWFSAYDGKHWLSGATSKTWLISYLQQLWLDDVPRDTVWARPLGSEAASVLIMLVKSFWKPELKQS